VTVNCLHGFFIFREDRTGELSEFMSIFEGLVLVPWRDAYTFEALAEAPDFSIEDSTYLGAQAIATFEGEPWEIMKENELVYDFTSGEVVPLESVVQRVEIQSTANYLLSNGLILPGSIMEDGSRVTDYAARYSFDTARFKYSEVTSV
jgi:hypothetical protein